jgi:hypothetical protein
MGGLGCEVVTRFPLFATSTTPSLQESLLDQFEYGMAGRVFQYDFKGDRHVDIFASFGGLLMLLHGEQLPLKNIEQDQNIYFLARKPAA